MQILVVEDDDISREMLENTLTQAGFDVETACDGIDALEKLRAGACRLVITDWDMPRMNGIELCQAIRRGEFAGYVYVILRHQPRQPAGNRRRADRRRRRFHQKAVRSGRVGGPQCAPASGCLSLESREVTIFALAKLAESRDPETGAHLDRVRNYCRLLAQQLAAASEVSRTRSTASSFG